MPVFRRRANFAFVFNAACRMMPGASLTLAADHGHAARVDASRVSQNDSSGSQFFGQLVEERTIYSQSSSRGSEKCQHCGTSKWSVQPPKNAQLLCRCGSP